MITKTGILTTIMLFTCLITVFIFIMLMQGTYAIVSAKEYRDRMTMAMLLIFPTLVFIVTSVISYILYNKVKNEFKKQ